MNKLKSFKYKKKQNCLKFNIDNSKPTISYFRLARTLSLLSTFFKDKNNYRKCNGKIYRKAKMSDILAYNFYNFKEYITISKLYDDDYISANSKLKDYR